MRRPGALAAATLLALTGACTDDDPAPTATAPATASSSVPAAAPSPSAPPAQTRTADVAGEKLTLSVEPLVRAGAAVVLTVRVRLDRVTGSAVATRHFSTSQSTSFDGARLVDETGRRVHLVAEGRAGDGCVCTGLLRVEPGETRLLQAVFTGVPVTVGRLSVMLPHAGVFTDVPVIAGTAPPPDGPDALGRTQQPLDPAAAGASLAAGLDAHTERLDVPLRTRRSADKVDISLGTDVLFHLDSARLTPAATRTIAAAVTELRAAGAGPLTITGHTDSTGTTAHNQALSHQRARAVADALAATLPEAGWPKTVAARGESEPVVPNDSADHRARNRRVTISFPARDRPAAEPPAAALPPTRGVRGRAPEGVEVALPLNRGVVRFLPGTAVRRGPFLLLNLVARNTGERKATIHDFLGQGVFTVRDEFDPFARYGAAGVRLLRGGSASYGLDYEVAPGDHRCLCDRLLHQAIPPGSERVLSLWFPAPPPGVRTVTVDVPDRLRITDVPIT